MEITQSEQQKEKQKKWEPFKGSLGQHQAYQHSYYRRHRRRRGREGGRKCTWWNYNRKFPKPEEGNRYPGMRSTEGPEKMNPNKLTSRHIIIKMAKIKERILNTA